MHRKLLRKIKVSVTDPIVEDVKGAINQLFALTGQKSVHLNFEQQNATPEPIAIRIEIISENWLKLINLLLSNYKSNINYFSGYNFSVRLAKSVIKKEIG